jgi:hypothetical protein
MYKEGITWVVTDFISWNSKALIVGLGEVLYCDSKYPYIRIL